MRPMIALHEPQLDQLDERFVTEAIRSTWVSTGGPFVDRFEKEMATFVGAPYAVSMSSGTVALQLMLYTLAKKQRIDGPFDVITPSLTFIATANAICHAGGRPIFVDSAPGSMNLSVDAVADTVCRDYARSVEGWRHKTSGRPLLAVMPAHIMGWTCDMEALSRQCSDLGIPLVEDAAEALGCRYSDGTHVGFSGLASAVSFNGNKILTTGGGGMIFTKDPAFAKHLKHLSTTAKSNGLRFVHDEVGFNFRLVNVLAAMGCAQLAKLPVALKVKRGIFENYREALNGSDVWLHTEQFCTTNNWIVNARFDSEQRMEKALKHLLDDNIQARPLWTPCHLQPCYKNAQGSFPETEKMWKTTLSLPSSPGLKSDDMARVVTAITSR